MATLCNCCAAPWLQEMKCITSCLIGGDRYALLFHAHEAWEEEHCSLTATGSEGWTGEIPHRSTRFGESVSNRQV